VSAIDAGWSRRDLLRAMIVGGGALSLGIATGCGSGRQAMIRRADEHGELAPNMYVTVMPDGRVALAINKAEIGQGVTTGYSTLVAEELEVPIDAVDFYLADSFPEYRTSFFMHQTGGSTSMKEGFRPLRQAAAAAREMLIGAAAATWGVAAHECRAENGHVTHPSGQRAGYGALTRAAGHLPVPAHPQLKARDQFTLIGRRGARVDVRGKVLGTTVFGIDVQIPHMVRALVMHPPALGAQAISIVADKARALPGVLDIFIAPFGVAIVADKYWQALAAARAVEVTWGPGIAKGLDTEALRIAMAGHRGDGARARDSGNVDKALGHAVTKLEATYEAPYLAHAPLEPQNCTVHVTGAKVEVWAPCQIPTNVQEFIAETIGVERDDVLVHTTFSGGGFGRRGVPDVAAEAAVIAKRVGRPVQVIWSRASDMQQGFYRPMSTATVRGGLDGSGHPVAFASHSLAQSLVVQQGSNFRAVMPAWMPHALGRVMVNSALAMFSSNTIGDLFATEGLKELPYQIPNVRIEFTPVETAVPIAFWRSVGHSFNGFVAESFVDELAHAARQDPFAFRRDLLPLGSRARRVLEAVAARSHWGQPLPAGVGRGIARHESFDSEVAEVAEVEIVDGVIRVRKVYCAIDCGIAVNPDLVRAQLEGAVIFGLSAALHQEITLVDGVVQQANFDTFAPLRMFEAPEIEVEILPSGEDPSGVGEPGLPPIGAAVANAVFAATGVRLRRLPLQAAWAAGGAR
jgi:CO/xanthine dehydrogenase Mo-binding subunit